VALAPAPPDFGYMFSLVALISIGLIMMYSTTAIEGGPRAILKMVVPLGVGGVAMLVSSRIPTPFWRKVAPLALVVCVLALLSLEIPGNPLAYGANGAVRWIKIAGPFNLQPSEFAKLAFVLFAARFLERRGERMQPGDWVAFLIVLGLLCGIIYKEPDLGTALVMAGTAFCMLIASGANWRTLCLLMVVGAVVVGTLAWNTQHQRERLQAYWNPFAEQYRQTDGYQVIQSWMAMARGGLWGVGLGQSQQKVDDRLPESETDFIFAVVSEELGLVRAAGVLLLFGVLTWRGYEIAARAPDRYSGLAAAGITSWVAVQACLNVAVVTGTVPNTGVPLPFISSGGSSLIALMGATGIVIGVSRRRRLAKKAA
jgi:cell division protein FtsW